ncbi:MAG TPA: hypothetical protein VGO72_04685 [Herminiimonas sp.]|jgi:hypothetical protein|nr:hypothetical protein [Herminiimonas sp.]
MALTNAEKQRRYRNRHLGLGGKRELLQCLISIPAKRNLERLACHHGHSLTTMLEVLVNERTNELLKKLNDWEQKNFFAQVPSYRTPKKKNECDWEQKSFYSRAISTRTQTEADDAGMENGTICAAAESQHEMLPD